MYIAVATVRFTSQKADIQLKTISNYMYIPLTRRKRWKRQELADSWKMKQGSLTQFFQSNGPIHWQGKLLLDYTIPPHTQYLLAQLFLAQYVRAYYWIPPCIIFPLKCCSVCWNECRNFIINSSFCSDHRKKLTTDVKEAGLPTSLHL